MNIEILERAIGAAILTLVIDTAIVSTVGFVLSLPIWFFSDFGFVTSWWAGLILSISILWVLIPVCCSTYRSIKWLYLRVKKEPTTND